MSNACAICVLKKVTCAASSIGGVRQPKVATDRVFDVLCAVNGLQVCGSQSKWQNYILKLVWLCVSTLYCTAIVKNRLEEFLAAKQKLNLTWIVGRINEFYFVLTSLHATFIFVTRRESIVSLLKTGNRRVRDVVLPWVTMLPYIVMVIVFGTAENLIRRVALVHALIMTAGFNLVYTDILENNRALLRDVSRCVERLELSSVARKKWHVREQIQKTNDSLAWLLSGYYVQILVGIVLSFTDTLAETKSYDAGYMSFGALLSFMFQIFLLAYGSSACASLCQKTEGSFSKLIDISDAACEKCQGKYLRVLKFREEWDSLKVGCFSQNVPNFLSFLITCITCVAVLLQFDFKVMGILSRLASQ